MKTYNQFIEQVSSTIDQRREAAREQARARDTTSQKAQQERADELEAAAQERIARQEEQRKRDLERKIETLQQQIQR